MRWLRRGRPYGMLGRSGSTVPIGCSTDQIDASVAPPRLITSAFGATARIRSGRLTGIQSPLSMTRRSPATSTAGLPAACTSSISIRAGTEFHTVTWWSASSRAQRTGSRSSPGPARTSAAPAARVPKMSYTDRSKPSEERANTRSSAWTSNRSLMSAMVLRAPRWSVITPLGSPVEPEV